MSVLTLLCLSGCSSYTLDDEETQIYNVLLHVEPHTTVLDHCSSLGNVAACASYNLKSRACTIHITPDGS